MRIDIWSNSREQAITDDATGLKILRKEIPTSGKPWVQIWKPKATKPFVNYTFRTDEEMERFILKTIENQKAHEKLILDRRAADAKPHDFKVGEIIYNSWGYDQTNIDFYQVVKTSAKFVWLRTLQQKTTESGFMSGRTIPTLGEFASEEVTMHKADARGYVNFRFGSGSRWDGQPKYSSWYA